MFDGVTYAKGACVLHALRGLVGDSAWWSLIRLYVATHKDQVVSTDDFKKAMEKASGRDLALVFRPVGFSRRPSRTFRALAV